MTLNFILLEIYYTGKFLTWYTFLVSNMFLTNNFDHLDWIMIELI